MTESEVDSLLARTDKVVVRPFLWTTEEGSRKNEKFAFDSSVQVGGSLPYAVRFVAKLRASKTITRGRATVVVPETFDAALLCAGQRVCALDTAPGKIHSNNVGEGRPFYGQRLTAPTHRHIWVGQYGYAEPIDPPILDVVDLIAAFVREYNLALTGVVKHPLVNKTGELF